MKPTPDIVEYIQFVTQPYACGYLPNETARLHYRIVSQIAPAAYEDLLSRGWRRFGHDFFRPVCQHCTQCRGLRIPVETFKPSRSQCRVLRGNEQIQVIVQKPTVTDEHIALYNAYHADMQYRRGWPRNLTSPDDYAHTFLACDHGFAREFLYFDAGRLVGVGLADVVPSALSSVYFFHDPQWRSQSPGTFSILQQMRFCQQQGLRYQYLGYWVGGCQSLAYKANYRPHEILEKYPSDQEEPMWTLSQATGESSTRGLHE